MKRIYIAGPMTGFDNYNKSAFNNTEEDLRDALPEFETMNPAKTVLPQGHDSWHAYMGCAISQLIQCSHVVFLEGWRESEGAFVEYLIASALGLSMAEQVPESDTVYDLLNLAPDSKYLPKAIEIVNGPRKASYGPPELCMKRSVDAMNNLLDAALSPPDLALAMICVKMARQFNSHDPDNYVDICGYALLYKQVKEYWNDPEPKAEELLVQELCAIEHEFSAMKDDYKALCDTLNDKENELIRLRAQVRRLTSCAE